jgi:CreA protein
MSKRFYTYLLVFIFIILLFFGFIMSYAYAERNIDTGISYWAGFTEKHYLRCIAFEDPENPFVTVYITHIEAKGLTMSDPSNMSIAVRLTKPVPVDSAGNQIVNKKANQNIFSISKSFVSKELKIGRYYDNERNVLVYISYSEKAIGGSVKHSLSVVPLGKQE